MRPGIWLLVELDRMVGDGSMCCRCERSGAWGWSSGDDACALGELDQNGNNP